MRVINVSWSFVNDLAKCNIPIARCQNFSLFITWMHDIIITKWNGVWALILLKFKFFLCCIIFASGARRVIANGRMLIEWFNNFFLFEKSLFQICFAMIINNKIGF